MFFENYFFERGVFMKKLLLLMSVSVVLAGMASATTWVRPTVNGPGNWNDPANWLIGLGVPTETTSVNVIFGQDASNLAEAQVTDAQSFGAKFQIGIASDGAVLRIKDGGSLSSGNGPKKSYVGYINDGTMIVDQGGSFTHTHRLILGLNTDTIGVVDVFGNLTVTSNNTYLGGYPPAQASGIGRLNVRGNGVANMRSFATDRLWTMNSDSFVDISGNGKVVTPLNEVDVANDRIAAGDIRGYGVVGNAVATYDGDNTTVTAIDDPLDRFPAYGELVYTGDVELSWINEAGAAEVEVRFGTDPTWVVPADGNFPPYYQDFPIVDSGVGLTSKTVSSPVDAEQYFWRVDTYFDPAPADPNEGLMMVFTALDDLPPASVVIDTPYTATWKNVPIALQATIDDDGISTVTVTWESDDLNAVFDSETYNPGTGIAAANVTVDYASGPFDVTVTASDLSTLPISVSDTVGLYCAEDACDASRFGYDLDIPGDIDEDCAVGLSDLVMLAAKWTDNYAEAVPFETPTE
jgi:hypothetical protein